MSDLFDIILRVAGDSADISNFLEKAKKPYKTYFLDGYTGQPIEELQEGDLLFWNFVQPEDKKAYFEAAPSFVERWNQKRWGTKQENGDFDCLSKANSEELVYDLETRGAPVEVFSIMTMQHPELFFVFDFTRVRDGDEFVYVGRHGNFELVEEEDPNLTS